MAGTARASAPEPVRPRIRTVRSGWRVAPDLDATRSCAEARSFDPGISSGLRAWGRPRRRGADGSLRPGMHRDQSVEGSAGSVPANRVSLPSRSTSSATWRSSAATRSSSEPRAAGVGGTSDGSSSPAPRSCSQRSSFWPGRRPMVRTSSRPASSLQRRLDVGRRVEPVQPLRALLELARRLRAAQHEHGQQRDFCAFERERLVEQMPVLGGAAAGAARESRPALTVEPLEPLPDRRLVVGDHRVAVRGLVAGEPERVQRQRVDIGRRSLLLDQAAEDPDLDGVCVHGHAA